MYRELQKTCSLSKLQNAKKLFFLLLDVLTNQKTSLSFVTIFAIKKIEKTEKDIYTFSSTIPKTAVRSRDSN